MKADIIQQAIERANYDKIYETFLLLTLIGIAKAVIGISVNCLSLCHGGRNPYFDYEDTGKGITSFLKAP